jgi:hypothetical protein
VGKPSDRDDLTSPASNDIIEATDVSDTTQSADGTSKKMTVSALATALDGLGLATDAELATHAALTAAHGIADTSALLTDSDVVDEDDMVSDDDTLIPTQQSVKAYVDTEIAGIVAPQAADVTADSSGLTLITGDDVAEQIAAADALIVGLDAGDLAAVFDDAGDIFVATAADTAAKLPRGTENHVLAATASTIAYKNVYEIPQVVQAARTADFTIAATDVGDVVPVAMALDGEVVTFPQDSDATGILVGDWGQINDAGDYRFTLSAGAGASFEQDDLVGDNDYVSNHRGAQIFWQKVAADTYTLSGGIAISGRVTASDEDLLVPDYARQVSQIGTMTAARELTIPTALEVPAGEEIEIIDESGTVTGTNTITVVCSGSDTIVSATAAASPTYVMTSGYEFLKLTSDGASQWTVTGSSSGAAGDLDSTIFDATGDLIVASAADTAVRLAKGANDTILGVNTAGTMGYHDLADVVTTGTWTDAGDETGELDGGKMTISQYISDQTYTADQDPLAAASGGTLGPAFLSMGEVNLDYVGDAPAGPKQATEYYGPRGVFQSEMTQVIHENQNAYGHGPVGFQDQMMMKNVAGETRTIVPGYTFISSRLITADGGTVTLKRTDASDGMTSFSDNSALMTAGSATMDASQSGVYQMNGFASMPIVQGNVTLFRRVGFYCREITGGVGAGPIFDSVPGIGGRLTNTVDNTAPTITEQYGMLVPRLEMATTNIGIQCDSPIRLWQDTVTFDANQSPVIDVKGTWTIGTGADLIPVAYSTTTNVVVDNTLNVFAVVNSFNNDVIYKSATNATVRDLKSFRAFADTGTVTADTSADTMSGYTSFVASATLSRVNSGTLALSELTGVAVLPSAVGAGVTVTTARGLQVRNPTGSGTVTNLYGLDIETLSKGGTKNRPIRLGAGRGIEFATQDSAHDTTSTLSASGAAIYTKGNNLVVSYNDAGTMRFLYIALTGTGTTWTHDTSGP